MNSQQAVPIILDPPPPGGDEVSILIVDDEPGNRETLADIFSEMGYHADTAATGQEALEKVRDGWLAIGLNNAEPDDVIVTQANLVGIIKYAYAPEDGAMAETTTLPHAKDAE